jgi:hypothetical protein
MKLAEALSLRADRHKRMLQLTERIKANALVQEGDAPSEDAGDLIQEFNHLANEFEDIVTRINRTNLAVHLSDGRSLTEAIARRDALKFHINLWRQVAEAGAVKQIRGTKSEIKFVSTINVREARENTDRFSKELRELDTKLQEANWLNDLLE